MKRSTGQIIILVLFVAAIVSQGLAQENIRIGVVNSLVVLERSTEGKRIVAQLEEKNRNNQQRIGRLDDEIRQLETKLNTQRLTLTDEALMNLSSDIERKRTDRKRYAEDSFREFQELRNRLFTKLQAEVKPIIDQLGKEMGLEIVFDLNNSGTIYFDSKIELTEEVIKRYDASKAPTKK
ncbi:MAG: OmpH family outer membrane protein [Candidatus Aminicenantes bacterium]|nr:OmpH family outer membrane protein [Candidatus Aminicenantes bacterium]MCK4759326.1 OmpH family outer membrane protein [Candidatus Aminicenantes bacterium]